MGKERPTSKAPLPITPVGGTSWTPRKPEPIQFPIDWPPNYPVHWRNETTLIMLDCAKQRTDLVEFCRCVIAKLIQLFMQDPKAPRPDLISPAVDELVGYILISNERDADQRYRLRQQLWQSQEAATPASTLAAPPAPETRSKVAAWEEVEIVFISDERVQIVAGTIRETLNYAEFGFEDGRSHKPDLAWQTLRALAGNRGTMAKATFGQYSRPRVEKRMQDVRRKLRTYFGLETDPLPFISGVGYKALFKISASPSVNT